MRIRPSGPLSAAMICASALAGFWTTPPKRARMEVDVGPDHVDLGVHHAPQAERDGRQVALEEAGVADHHDVGGQALPVGLEPAGQVDRARFLLALEQVAHVERELATRGQQRPPRPSDGRGSGPCRRPLRGPAGVRPSITGSNGGDVQSSSGIDRLDVVVAVDQDGRGAGGVQPVGVDRGVAAGLAHLGMLEAGRGQARRPARSRRPGNRPRGRAGRRCWGSGGTSRYDA